MPCARRWRTSRAGSGASAVARGRRSGGETARRVAVGLPMAAVLAGMVLAAPAVWLGALAAVVVALAAQEWAHLSGFGLRTGWALGLVMAGLSLLLAYLHPIAQIGYASLVMALIALYWGSVAALVLLRQLRGPAKPPRLSGLPWHWRLAALPLLLPLPFYVYSLLGTPWPVRGGGAWLAALPHLPLTPGRVLLFGALALAVLVDVAGYFGGCAWGRRKLAPAISGGKTWEGTLCGLATAAALGIAFLSLLGAPVWAGLGVGLVLGVAAVLGDLYESLVKRLAAVKDSSHLLSAHGGVLDRGDSHFCVLAWASFMALLLGLVQGPARPVILL